jgi:phage antirepressor YoqD-like protein
MSGIEILEWLKEHGYVVGEYSIVPSQKALDEGLLNMLVEYVVGRGENEGINTEVYTLIISPKGQEFFVNEILREHGVRA